jgi:predicted esterase
MLLLHGDQDPIVSIESQRTFFLELRDAYGQQGNRVTMKETNGLGHFIELDMVENWCDWLVSVL